MRPNIKKAKRHLARIREIIAQNQSPFSHMSEEKVIEKIRKDRKNIWEEKFAPRA